MCTYEAIALVWRLGVQSNGGVVPGKDAPFFLSGFSTAHAQPQHLWASHVWTSHDSLVLAREIAAYIGEDAAQYGGKSFRIGGATDLREVMGTERAEEILRQRGRWKSDIWRIYARTLASALLNASAAVAAARRRDMEALCRGWVQPARR